MQEKRNAVVRNPNQRSPQRVVVSGLEESGDSQPLPKREGINITKEKSVELDSPQYPSAIRRSRRKIELIVDQENLPMRKQENEINKADPQESVSFGNDSKDSVEYIDQQEMLVQENGNIILDYHIPVNPNKASLHGGSLEISSKNSFLNPIKANVETQTVNENVVSIVNQFDITKMEPYTVEFLKILEGEFNTLKSFIKEVKEGIPFFKT